MNRKGRATNLALALLAVGLLFTSQRVSGEIPINDGLGWDGQDYAAMLREGLVTGSANTALRPLVIWLNRPVGWLLGSPVTTFRFMNLFYAGLLCLVVCLLFDRYSNDRTAKTVLIVNLFLCISTVRYAGYYPVLVDLGAQSVIALAIYSIVSGSRTMSVLLTIAAVLAREFGMAAVVFGVVRDVRRRVPIRTMLATYAPATVAFVGLRAFVTNVSHRGNELLSLSELLRNLEYWTDPVFVALFAYFAVTVYGGPSLFLASRPYGTLRHWMTEWEWGAFSLLIVAVAAAGDADIWRYLAYLLPAVVVSFAVTWSAVKPAVTRVMVGALLTLATLVTQRPFTAVDLETYFVDWFPYYIELGGAPIDSSAELWPLWGWRLLMTGALLGLLSTVRSASGSVQSKREPA